MKFDIDNMKIESNENSKTVEQNSNPSDFTNFPISIKFLINEVLN